MSFSHALLNDAAFSQLLIIDVQARLAGAMPEKVKHKVIDNIAMLSQAANLLEVPIVRTEQYPQGLGSTEDQIAKHLTNPAIEKTCFSCCGNDDFLRTVEHSHRKQIVITGMESHVCVLQTAIQLMSRGYQAFVVEDAVCSRDKAHHKNALRRLTQAGAMISNAESVMFEWMRDAKHPQFKTISKLLR